MDASGKVTHTVTTWAEFLSEISPENLEWGVRACSKRNSPFPPTLPEFITLCKAPTTLPAMTGRVL